MAEVKDMNSARVERVEDGLKGASANEGVINTSTDAAAFEAKQHELGIKESVLQNWKPLLWTLYSFFLTITWGFEGLAGGIVVSIPQFRKDFGVPFGGDYVIDANWQLGWLAATLFGLVFGGLVTGVAVNRVGRKICILVAYLLTTGGVFVQFFATNNQTFFGGKVLTGLSMGAFVTIAPPYASEMTPLAIRGAVTAAMNFSIVLGQLIGYGVFRQTSFYNDNMQYKVLFATQWGFCVIGLICLPFFPESPYWLIAHGQTDKARQTLVKLHAADYDVNGDLAQIHEALARVNAESESQGSMLECFSKAQWKRTLVGTSMIFIQNASGNSWVIGYMTYFMTLGGLPASQANDASVGLCGLMLAGNMAGWFFVEYFGRRGTALWGTIFLTITLFLIGIFASVTTPGAIKAQVAFMAVWGFIYQGTIGSVTWPIITENATSRLRSPTLGLATMMNGLSACIWSFSLPYAINPDQGNLGGKIAYVFGGVLVVACVFIFFMIPETKNRTYIEIDELWTRKISPRRFKETQLVVVADEAKDH